MNLADPSLLDKIDKLRELNVSDYIPLPQVCFLVHWDMCFED